MSESNFLEKDDVDLPGDIEGGKEYAAKAWNHPGVA
jgi:hypothetical protein